MPAGTIQIDLRDGGLGIVPPNSSGIAVSMGTCSKISTPQVLSFTQIDDIASTLGDGPLSEDLAYRLAIAGGTVYACPVNPSVVGVISAWTADRVGISTGTVSTYSGLPGDSDRLVVKVVSSGASQLVTGGNVAVQVSLDNGATFGNRVLVPTTGIMALTKAGGLVPQDRGDLIIQLSASSTTFDEGDQFTATCQAPYYSTTDLANAFTALLGDPKTWGLVHVVGYPTAGNSSTNASGSAAMNVACTTGMSAAFQAGRDARLILDTPPSTDADLGTAFASVPSDPRVTRAAGTEQVISPLTGAQRTTSHGTPFVARLCQFSASHSPGCPADGPLLGTIGSPSRDERVHPGLYDQGFTSPITIIGLAGIYCDDGRTSASSGSDFVSIMNCRVIDLVVSLCRAAGLHFQNQSFRVDQDGHILPIDAASIERYVGGTIVAAAGTEFSSVSVSVYRTDNVLSTRQLRFKVRVVPLAYAHDVVFDVGYVNPALLAA